MSQSSVGILGARSDRSKFGNKSARANAQAGYQVFPVNPKGGTIEGLSAYASLADVPVERLSRVSLYLPPKLSLAALDEIAAKGCDELWFNPGTESAEALAKARQLGLNAIAACSIVDLGLSPAQFP